MLAAGLLCSVGALATPVGLLAAPTDNAGGVTTSDGTFPPPAPSPSPSPPSSGMENVVNSAALFVYMTAPRKDTAYLAGIPIDLAATAMAMATDTVTNITKVEFFDGTTLLATVTQAPHRYRWSGAAAGRHAVTAKATDDRGYTATSAAITITVTVGNVPPTVSISSPAMDARFTAPAAITIDATANDGDGMVVQLAFYQGSTLLATLTAPPYRYSWTNVAAGQYAITAKATDSQGAATTSAAIAVTVAANVPPTIGLTAPVHDAAYVAGTPIDLTATATDADGSITKVEFFDGPTLLGTVTQPPYTYRWSGAVTGSHAVTATATDNAGARTTSAAITLTIAAANVPPTVSITSPARDARFTAPAAITIDAAASDSDGTVAQVAFYRGGTLLATLAAPPYRYSWTNVTAGTHVITVRATDNVGAQATSSAITVSVADNVRPEVSMIATPTNATAPATIMLNAAASDADGSVARVEFFNGSTLLASVSAAPYVYNWMNVAAGNYTILAKATDDRGAVTISESAAITVTAIPAVAQVLYIDSDHLNTPRVITDANNQIVWQWENSDPFGGNLPREDPGSTGNRLEFNLRFPGQYFDRESGLHYNYHRDYDPSTGRYIESDPIGLDAEINTYAYVENNPISMIDPLGLEGVGHHWVPQSIWRNAELPADTARVFDRSVTGPLPDGSRHGWDKGHSEYNKGVRDLWNNWLKEKNIDPKHMTPRQADDFINKVHSCGDPRVRDYAVNVKKVLFRSYLRRIPIRGID